MLYKVQYLRRYSPKRLAVLLTVLVLVLTSIGSFAFRPRPAHALTNSSINFQARLMNSSGAIVPDGFYNVEFKIYDALTSGTLLFTDTYYDSNGVTAGNDARIRVANGYLTVALGSQAGNPFPSTINWDRQLWITMNIGGTTQTATPTYDGEMSPRLQLTAVPYAFRAGQLGQFNSSTGFQSDLSIVPPTGGDQHFVLPDQGAAGTYNLLTTAAAATSFVLLQTATPGTPQTGHFNITGTGIAGTLQAATIDSPSGTTTLNIGTANATTAVNLGSGSVGTLSLQAGSVVNVGTNANNKTVNVGATGATANTTTINIATSTAAAQTINIGSTNGASAINLSVGTGNFSLDGAGGSTYTLGASTTTGTITVGGTAQTGAISIGTGTGVQSLDFGTGGTGAKTVTVGSTASTGATTIQSGTGGTSVQSAAAGTISIGTTNNNAITTGTGLLTQGGNITFNGTSARTITGPATGGLTINTTTGPLTLSTTTSGTLAVSSAGALDLTGAANSTWTVGGNTLAITSSNFSVTTGGVVNPSTGYQIGGAAASGNFLRGNGTNFVSSALQSSDIPVCTGSCNYISNQTSQQASSNFNISGTGIAGVALQAPLIQTADVTGASAGITLRSGNSTTSGNSGAVGITSGNATSGNSGDVTIDAGTASGTAGSILLGSANAAGITLGRSGMTTSVAGALSVAANQSLTLQSGTGTFTQTYSNNTGTAATFAVTDNASSGTTAVQGVSINLTGTNNAGGTNALTGMNFANVTPATNNSFYGMNFGTGYTDLLRYNGTQLISGTGIVQSAAINGSYTGITGVGTLTAGALGAGFTTVNVAQGGTGAATFTSNGVLYGNGTAAIQATAAGTTGQCLVGTTGAAPSWGTCATGTVSLQSAYGGGNTISTSSNDIAFTLNGSDNFTVTTAAGATGGSVFSLADGSNATPPAQLVKITNSDIDQVLAAGLKVTSAAGGITTAIDVSGSNITNALAIGANAISGTNFSVTNAGAVTAVGVNSGSGLLQGTGGLTLAGNANFNVSNTNGITVTSDLSGGARSTPALLITQANDATNSNTSNLLKIQNSDSNSTAAALQISNVSAGKSINISGTTTGTAIDISGSNLTSGTGFNADGSNLTSGSLLSLGGSNAGVTAGFTGSLLGASTARTLTSGSVTDSGNFLNFNRSNTVNNAASTYTISGALATLQSNCTQTAGTCTDTSNILNLSQSYANASGAVLNVGGAGTGNLAVLDATNTGANGVSIDVQASASSKYALSVTSNNGATNVLYARADGRVGIGNAAPSAALDVTGSANISSTLTVQGANALTLGTTGTNTGAALFKGSSAASGTITLTLLTNNPTNNTISLPNETGTVCTTGSVCAGYQAAPASGSYIQTVPTGTVNVIQPTAASVIALTVNGTSNATGATALVVAQSQANDAVDINVSNATGTVINALQVANTGAGGALTNGLSFSGTIGTDISRGSGTLTLQGAGGVTISSTNVAGASGAILIQGGNSSGGTAGNVTLDTGTTSTGTPTVNIGNTNAKAVQIGNNTSNPSVTIDSGTSAINVGTGGQARTVTIGSTGAGSAVAQVFNIGTNTTAGATNTVAIGSTTATASVTTINGGTASGTSTSGALVLQAGSGGSINIGNTAATKTVNIGSTAALAGDSTINIATSSSNVQTVTIGSTNSTSGTTIQGGTNNITLTVAAGTVANANKIITTGGTLQATGPAGVASGATTMTASAGASTFTTSTSITLSAGDYIIPTTTTAQARVVTTTATGTSFSVSPVFGGAVTAETFAIHRPISNFLTSSGATGLAVQGSTGNVGVGTVAPTRQLHVAVNTSSVNTLPVKIAQSGAGDVGIEFNEPAQSFYVGIDASDHRFKISSDLAGATISNMGYATIGASTDSSNSNTYEATKFTAGATGTVSSVYGYVGAIIGSSPNNKGQAAIYSDSSGTPGSRLGYSTADTTLTANAWNVFPITATSVTNGTVYWLVYNTNGTAANQNDLKFDAGSANQTRWSTTTSTYGTWQTTWPGTAGSSATQFSMYAPILVNGSADNLQNSLFQMSASGQTLFQNSSDSVLAFQVQNAAGTNLIGLDTSSSILNLGITGSTATASTVNIATSTGATQTISVGATGSGTAAAGTLVNIQGGTTASTAVTIGTNGAGGITIDTGTTGGILIGAGTSNNAKTITIGPTATKTSATTVQIGVNTAGTETIHLGSTGSGNAAAGTTLNLQAGTTANTALTLGTNGAGGITIDTGTTGNILIGAGTSNNAKTITVGPTATKTSATTLQLGINTAGTETIQLGSAGSGDAATGTTVNIQAGTTANTAVTIGTNGAGGITIDSGTTGNVNIGNGANAKTVTLGSTNTTSTTLIQSGTGHITLQAGGTSTVDRIQIGAGGAGNSTPDYLALDVKSDTGDPAGGAEGYMYYNTLDNKFRCFQNTGWTDCIATSSGGVTTVGAFSGSSQTNGASISGSTITFGPADGTNPGMVTTGTQSFAGDKTFTGNVIIQGTTGLTFNTGAGGDITFANLEKIDNDTNGQINLQADSGALTLKLTGTAGTITNSAGALTLDSFNNTLTVDSSDTTLSATGLTAINLGSSTSFSTGGTVRMTVAGSNNVYFGNGVTAGTPNNFSIQGTGSTTTAVAGGSLTVQGGNATVGNANGGNVTLAGGSGFGTGVQGLVVLNTPTFATASTQSCGSNCNITQANVDGNGAVVINATAASLTVTMPDPSITTAGRIVYVTAANGSNDFTLSVNGGGTGNQIAMRQNTSATMIWNGVDWTAAGASSSTTLQAAYNNTLTSAGGAELIVSNGANANGLTVRDSLTSPISGTGNGTLLEVQTAQAADLFSVNSSVTDYANNGGAESTFVSEWATIPSAGATVTRNTSATYIATGAASVSVATSTAANSGAENVLTTTLTANLRYNVSFATKLTAGSAAFTDLDVEFSKDGTTTAMTACTNYSTQTVATSVWSKVNCTFTAPASGITGSNAIFIRQTASGTARTFYVDNLSVTISADLNYATDGGVDDNTNFGTNWPAVAGTGATVTAIRSTTNGNDTSDSAEAHITVGGSGGNNGIRNKLSINPLTNTLYRVSVYASSSTAMTDFTVRYSRDGGTNFDNCVDYNSQSLSGVITTFKQITCYVTTSGTAASTPYVYFTEAGTSVRDIYVDTFTMTIASNAVPNVQIGGGVNGGPTTLFTLDRAASAPIAANNDALLGSMYYDTTLGKLQCYELDGWGACGSSPDNIITISPEYTNAVLHGPSGGAVGVGTMTSDLCSDALNINDGSASQPTICGSNETFNFYKWTSPQGTAQTYAIYVTYQLPTTFKSFASGSTSIKGRTDSSNATVAYKVYRNAGSGSGLTQCGSAVSVSTGSVGSWQPGLATGTADPSTCSFVGGDSVVFEIDMTASSNANAYVSNLGFTFSNR